MFEDGSWKAHKQHASKQHEQQSGDDANLCLRDGPLLRCRDVERSDGERKPYFSPSSKSSASMELRVFHFFTLCQQQLKKIVLIFVENVRTPNFINK